MYTNYLILTQFQGHLPLSNTRQIAFPIRPTPSLCQSARGHALSAVSLSIAPLSLRTLTIFFTISAVNSGCP